MASDNFTGKRVKAYSQGGFAVGVCLDCAKTILPLDASTSCVVIQHMTIKTDRGDIALVSNPGVVFIEQENINDR